MRWCYACGDAIEGKGLLLERFGALRDYCVECGRAVIKQEEQTGKAGYGPYGPWLEDWWLPAEHRGRCATCGGYLTLHWRGRPCIQARSAGAERREGASDAQEGMQIVREQKAVGAGEEGGSGVSRRPRHLSIEGSAPFRREQGN